MAIVDNIIISSELTAHLHFCCYTKKCKGACCVAGDAGAPLEEEEVEYLQNNLEMIKPYMQKHAEMIVHPDNLYDFDEEGQLVTSLIDDNECIFTNFENGIAYCAVEKAWFEKKITFRKPISCFLYPIRISKDGAFLKLHYHKWDICQSAVEYGRQQHIQLIDFLKTPLIEKFGNDWYKKFYNIIKNK